MSDETPNVLNQPRCPSTAGRGIGAGHVCRCVANEGHTPFTPMGHGCECGALWD